MDINSKYMQDNTRTKFIARPQMQSILDNAPQGVDKKALIDKFVAGGFTVEGVNDKKEPNIAQNVASTLLKAPIDLIGAGFAGAGALGSYAGKKLAGQDTTLSQEYQNQSQQVQQSGANPVVQTVTGQDVRPAQDVGQLAGDVLQTGALVSPGTGLVKGAATGAALMGGQALSESQNALDVAKNTLLGAGIGGALGVALPALEKFANTVDKVAPEALAQGGKALESLKPDPVNIMQRVLRVTKGQQSKFEQNYGTSIGQYIVDRGLIGTQEKVITDLANRFTTSIKAADEALASLPGKYKPEAVKTALQDLLQKKMATSAKGAIDPEMNSVKELINKFENVGLDMSEINQAKRLYERNVKLDFVKTNNPEGVKLANNIDQAIREWQFGQAERLGLKNLPEINKETRMAKDLLNSLERESSGKAGNNAISLTDWIVLADGGATNIMAFLAKKGLSSDSAQAFVAKYFAPEAKIGMPSAKLGTPQIDATVQSYLDFLKKTGAISQETKKKVAPQIKQKLSPLKESIAPTTKKASSIPKELQPLAEEARTTKVYHGTSAENASKINKEGFKVGAGKGVSGQSSNDFIYATRNKASAGNYVADRLSIKNPTVVSGNFTGKTLDVKGKMADFEAFGEASKMLGVPLKTDSQGRLTMLDMEAIKKAMKEQGYGAIKFKDMYANGKEAYAVLPENIKK